MNFTKLILTVGAVLLGASSAFCATYYVDSRSGSDDNDGLTEQTAWNSLTKVNQSVNQPGDRILFARGGLWRGTLRPHSGEQGAPIYYGAYGSGPKPKFYGSVDYSNPQDWTQIKPNLWATREIKPELYGAYNTYKKSAKTGSETQEIDVQGDGNWSVYVERGIPAKARQDGNVVVVETGDSMPGLGANQIQAWGPSVEPLKKGEAAPIPDAIVVKFRARCSAEFAMPSLTVQLSGQPWTRWLSSPTAVKLTDQWTEFALFLTHDNQDLPKPGETVRYHISLGKLPSNAKFELELLGANEASIDLSKKLVCDVGNIIFDHGNFTKFHRCGIKKWSLDELTDPGYYFYNQQDGRVYMNWPNNPADDCASIEMALRKHVIDEGGCRDVVFENLAVAYGAAHGFGGGNVERITIRSCDVYYIGGGHQHDNPNGTHVRFGNGIEFWNSCKDCLVVGNRLWEIYDAALTNQGKGEDGAGNPKSMQINVTYRNNVIWNAEYSYEYWNRDKTQKTAHILFENNTCVDAGVCWSHGQRPNPNGAHLMFYQNSAQTEDFVVRNNIFVNSTEVCLRMDNDWRPNLTLENNLWYQPELPIVRWLVKTYYQKDELAKFQQETGLEQGGIAVKPTFRNPNLRDYRLTDEKLAKQYGAKFSLKAETK